MRKSIHTVLITGCSSGIGYLTALTFARHGYQVFATMRDTTGLQANMLKQIVNNENLSIEIMRLDIKDHKSIRQAVEEIKGKGLTIDILVNNAGFGYVGPVEAFSIDEVREQFETNVFGTLRVIQEILPLMRKRKSGMIITISSIHGFLTFPLWGIYAASKHAIEAFTEALRFEVAPFGIKVALVEPGAFSTNFTSNRKFPKNIEKEDNIYRKLTLTFFKKFDDAEARLKKNKLFSLAINPQKVADVIFSVSQKQNPKMQYRVGIDANIYYFAKKIIPYSLWQSVIKRVYGL